MSLKELKREWLGERIDCHHQDSNQGPSHMASDALPKLWCNRHHQKHEYLKFYITVRPLSWQRWLFEYTWTIFRTRSNSRLFTAVDSPTGIVIGQVLGLGALLVQNSACNIMEISIHPLYTVNCLPGPHSLQSCSPSHAPFSYFSSVAH